MLDLIHGSMVQVETLVSVLKFNQVLIFLSSKFCIAKIQKNLGRSSFQTTIYTNWLPNVLLLK